MLVGVLADSHDRLTKLDAALELFRRRRVEHILHAGDFVAPFAVKRILACGIPFTGVFGNNDGETAGLERLAPSIFPEPHALELGGRRIILVHDLANLPPQRRKGADAIVFGHTHEPHLDPGPPLLLNPGECCGWVNNRPTVALLDLATLEATILDL